jgi:site-specific DNA-methyltransferase (adenine-specific)
MRLIPRDSLIIPEKRQRSEIRKESLVDLKDSIASIGLLQPPIVRWEGEHPRLVAGARRTAAIDALQTEGIIFFCNGQIVTPGEYPCLDIGDLNPVQLFEAELSENIIREALHWHDETLAIAELHKMRKEVNPKQTITETAREMVEKVRGPAPEGEAPARSATGGVSTYRSKISQALTIAQHIDEPEVAKARNAKEAFQLVLKREHATYQAELLRRKSSIARVALSCEIRHGSMLDIMPKLDPDQFDLILTDPPYGIGVSGAGFRARTVHHHNYDDTPENARAILKCLVSEGWRVTKNRANLCIFTDIDHWDFLQTIAKQQGWSTWKWPVIWQKSEHEGMTGGWGHQGFIRTYEMIFFATKGQRGLVRTELDILTEKRVSRTQRVHGAEKPTSLMELLLDLTTFPGDKVLDPCCGSGTTLMAAKRLNRHGLGIEIDKVISDEAYVRLHAVKPDAEEPEEPEEQDMETEDVD